MEKQIKKQEQVDVLKHVGVIFAFLFFGGFFFIAIMRKNLINSLIFAAILIIFIIWYLTSPSSFKSFAGLHKTPFNSKRRPKVEVYLGFILVGLLIAHGIITIDIGEIISGIMALLVCLVYWKVAFRTDGTSA